MVFLWISHVKKDYFDSKGIISYIVVAIHIDFGRDLNMITKLRKSDPRFNFIIVPYNVSDKDLDKIIYEFDRKTMLFSQCDELADFHDTQNFMIDFNVTVPNIITYGSAIYKGIVTNFPDIENLVNKVEIACYDTKRNINNLGIKKNG